MEPPDDESSETPPVDLLFVTDETAIPGEINAITLFLSTSSSSFHSSHLFILEIPRAESLDSSKPFFAPLTPPVTCTDFSFSPRSAVRASSCRYKAKLWSDCTWLVGRVGYKSARLAIASSSFTLPEFVLVWRTGKSGVLRSRLVLCPLPDAFDTL